MSWENQGGQYHACFGNGTTDGATDPTGTDVDTLIFKALSLLHAPQQEATQQALTEGGARDLTEALPIWVASSDLDDGRFRSLVVGPGFSKAGADSLQALAQEVKEGFNPESVARGSKHLATALTSASGAGLRYGLNYARDMAAYAAANGLVPDPAAGAGQAAESVSDQILQSAPRSVPL